MTPRQASRALEARTNAWDPQRRSLTYAEWISYASYHPDQNLTWREHERLARENYRDAGDGYELGGEA